MARTTKICSPYVAGGAGAKVPRSGSDQIATNERVDNIRIAALHMPSRHVERGASATFARRSVLRAAVEQMKLWENGRTIRVKFLDGLSEVQQKVEAIAKEWEAVTNLKLKFVTSGASEIRISFADEGFSWSTVGTDALTVASSRATMNYGWLTPSTSTREYQRVVRHEFGHALGMIHEHQNPAADIPWDKEKVYAYYADQGWSRADVDFNIFDVYEEDSTNHTSFDPTSIMQYAVPNSLTVGNFSIGWNTSLSATDLEFMRLQYPRDAVGTTEIEVGGARIDADLAAAAEVDTYHFVVREPATHIITTEGPGDTILTVHGPNDPGAILTWDDDRGKLLNARVVRKLWPGEYWLSVRHKDSATTGVYSVGLKKRR